MPIQPLASFDSLPVIHAEALPRLLLDIFDRTKRLQFYELESLNLATVKQSQ